MTLPHLLRRLFTDALSQFLYVSPKKNTETTGFLLLFSIFCVIFALEKQKNLGFYA